MLDRRCIVADHAVNSVFDFIAFHLQQATEHERSVMMVFDNENFFTHIHWFGESPLMIFHAPSKAVRNWASCSDLTRATMTSPSLSLVSPRGTTVCVPRRMAIRLLSSGKVMSLSWRLAAGALASTGYSSI